MTSKWLSKPFFIVPVIALFLLVVAQTMPRGEMHDKIIKVDANVEKIYPRVYKYGLHRSRGKLRLKKILVSYEAASEGDMKRTYSSETMVPEHQIRQYIVKDKITLFYKQSRPDKVFSNSNYPPQYNTLNILGVMILVFWGMFTLVSNKP